MISVTFALPQESRAFISGLSAVRPAALAHSVRGRLGGQEVLVAHTGVGAACALTRVSELLRLYQPKLLLSAGFAGGLDSQGRMVLSDATDSGSAPIQRITWTPLPNGRVRQLWETSTDHGVTWTTAFDGLYGRN